MSVLAKPTGFFEGKQNLFALLAGGVSPGSVNAGIDVLAGNYPAKGVLTYDVNFQ